MVKPFISNPAVDLGVLDYETSLSLQRTLVDTVRGWKYGDILLFLSHPPVFTIGRRNIPENYKHVQVIETERGGDVTYHGPGQLVIYPIIDLERNNLFDVRKFVNLLENVIISSLSVFGYNANKGDEPGIWVGNMKIASIGLAVRNKVSFHGASINIGREVVEGFSRIKPCGMEPGVIGYVDIDRDELISEVIKNFNIYLHEFNLIDKECFFSGISIPP